ncbi:hypothetical protein Pd630_LPD10005 (plasmid) [Rhodococcus opacus PD630]|nr:hypothetical protein Pd630_LPD10005 [Rhodococcus opacus PD630]
MVGAGRGGVTANMLSGLGRRGRKASTRSRLESIIASLALPEDWTIVQFVQSVEQLRGRKIHLLELPDSAPVGLCGLWLARPNDDVVFHRASSDPEQTRHTVSHEIGHMLCDHGDDGQIKNEEMGREKKGGVLGPAGEESPPICFLRWADGEGKLPPGPGWNRSLLASRSLRTGQYFNSFTPSSSFAAERPIYSNSRPPLRLDCVGSGLHGPTMISSSIAPRQIRSRRGTPLAPRSATSSPTTPTTLSYPLKNWRRTSPELISPPMSWISRWSRPPAGSAATATRLNTRRSYWQH